MIELQPWSGEHLEILQKTLGNPAMMEHLGGIETPEQIAQRHARYLTPGTRGSGGMFAIAFEDRIVGSVGYWETAWRGERVYEAGWMVLPEYGGRGIATQAAREILARAAMQHKHRFVHAFPSVHNAPSNAVCAKAGFTNRGQCTVEYPKGHFMRSNDWRFDLLRRR